MHIFSNGLVKNHQLVVNCPICFWLFGDDDDDDDDDGEGDHDQL